MCECGKHLSCQQLVVGKGVQDSPADELLPLIHEAFSMQTSFLIHLLHVASLLSPGSGDPIQLNRVQEEGLERQSPVAENPVQALASQSLIQVANLNHVVQKLQAPIENVLESYGVLKRVPDTISPLSRKYPILPRRTSHAPPHRLVRHAVHVLFGCRQ